MPVSQGEVVNLGKLAVTLGEKIAKALSADSDGGKVVTRQEAAAMVRDVLALLGALVVAILT